MQLTESDVIYQAIWSKPFRRPLELCDGDLTTAICIHFASPGTVSMCCLTGAFAVRTCYLQGTTSGTAFSIYAYSCSNSSTKSIKKQARLLQIFDTRSLKWLLFCIKVSWSRSSTANLFWFVALPIKDVKDQCVWWFVWLWAEVKGCNFRTFIQTQLPKVFA